MMNNLQPPRNSNTRNSNIILYSIVLILVLTSILFRLLNNYKFEQTSILFIGVPAFIVILVITYVPTRKSIYSIVFKTITLFLLLSGILLGEGIVCILFMAPLFYGVGALLSFIYTYIRRRTNKKTFSLIVLPLLLFIARPDEFYSHPPLQSIKSTRILNQTVTLEQLNESPDFLKDYPQFFKLGFPKPIDIQGQGTQIGDTRVIQFHSQTKGIGALTLETVERKENYIKYKPITDFTHINHWLTWKEIIVEQKELANNQTQITWTTTYQCDLGPRWYFEPFEKYVVQLMNEHLLNAYFNE